jgi:hypothetical protein
VKKREREKPRKKIEKWKKRIQKKIIKCQTERMKEEKKQ